MKIIKNPIFTFIIGAILFSFITAYATLTYEASQINYKSTTLDHAIDELYTTQNNQITNLTNEKNDILNRGYTFGTLVKNGSYGDQVSTRTASITLDKGKYLISALKGRTWAAMSTTSTSRSDATVVINCSNTCNKTNIMGHQFLGHGSNPFSSTHAVYSRLSVALSTHYVEILTDQTVVSLTWELDENQSAVEDVEIMAKSISK